MRNRPNSVWRSNPWYSYMKALLLIGLATVSIFLTGCRTVAVVDNHHGYARSGYYRSGYTTPYYGRSAYSRSYYRTPYYGSSYYGRSYARAPYYSTRSRYYNDGYRTGYYGNRYNRGYYAPRSGATVVIR